MNNSKEAIIKVLKSNNISDDKIQIWDSLLEKTDNEEVLALLLEALSVGPSAVSALTDYTEKESNGIHTDEKEQETIIENIINTNNQ